VPVRLAAIGTYLAVDPREVQNDETPL